MSTVYQHQLHAHKTHRPHPWRWVIGISLVLIIAVAYGLYSLKPDTKISKAKPVTRTLNANTAVDTYNQGAFTIQLPKGWQFMGKQQDIYTIYHFRSALPGEKGNRSIDIYEDTPPKNFAVNRMLPVAKNEDGGLVTDLSLVSDNCAAYTTDAGNRTSVAQLAKWQGIEFLCDMGNTLRNTVGTGSKDGINTVRLQTATSRPHQYFFTYTENNDKPDYNLFVKAINSFKVTE